MAGTVTTMSAAVYKGDRSVEVERVPVPEPGEGEVLLEISHCGICGTDLHLISEGWGVPGAILGHEYSGVVSAVGPGVGEWSPGDRAVGGPGRGCGRCRLCRRGHSHLCLDRMSGLLSAKPGAFASCTVVEAASLYRVPEGLELRSAALAEPAAVALRGVRRAAPSPGDRVLVSGAGPIGLLTAAILRAQGVGDITVSEPHPLRRDLAARLGATVAVPPERLERPSSPTEIVERPFQVAIECSGSSDAMEAALANLDRAGRLILSGAGMRPPRFDPNRIILHELAISGTVEYSRDDFESALELLGSGVLPVGELVYSEDQPLSRLGWALERLAAGEIAGKVMVTPNAPL